MPAIDLNKARSVYEITYSGKGLSLNSVRGGKWRETYNKQVKLKDSIGWLIKAAKIPKVDRFKIIVTFNCSYDADNTVPMAKLYCDCLKSQKIVKDDDKRFYKSLTLEHDETLPFDTWIFKLIPLN